MLRINDESTPWFEADLDMLAQSPGVELMLPKAERQLTVARVRATCPGSAVLALIESARGVLNAVALAQCEGISRLVFGTVDYALELELIDDPSAGPLGLDHAASQLALASRAAGLAAPVAGVTPDIDDETKLLADLARARAHGFGAKLCIHPKQVAPIHGALQPSARRARLGTTHRRRSRRLDRCGAGRRLHGRQAGAATCAAAAGARRAAR